MLKLAFLSLLITSWAFAIDCSNDPFNYSITRQPSESGHDDFVLTYEGGSGTRTIKDDDGMLTVMALYRSWQTQDTDVLPRDGISLIHEALDKFEAYRAATPNYQFSESPEAIANLKAALPRDRTVRFSQVRELFQQVLSPIFVTVPGQLGGPLNGAHYYEINYPDGKGGLKLCASTGNSRVCGSRSGGNGAIYPQCEGVWNDFCGVGAGETVGAVFGPERIQAKPRSCHFANIEGIYSTTTGQRGSRSRRASDQ